MKSYTNIKTKPLTNQSAEELFWSNHANPKRATFKEIYNPVKHRKEGWYRRSPNHDWQLDDLDPGIEWEETFIGPIHAFVGVVGISLDKTWGVNGNPAPTAPNFVEANQVGGGLILRCLGAGGNDWVAMHTGAQYPIVYYNGPHFHVHMQSPNYTNTYFLAGFVGASNLETGNNNPWTVPDNGIWFEHDTNIDNRARFVTRSGGVEQSSWLGSVVAATGEKHSTHFYVNDYGTEAIAIIDGVIRCRHTLHIPTAQLKPLFMCGVRAANQRERWILDFKMLYDHSTD